MRRLGGFDVKKCCSKIMQQAEILFWFTWFSMFAGGMVLFCLGIFIGRGLA